MQSGYTDCIFAQHRYFHKKIQHLYSNRFIGGHFSQWYSVCDFSAKCSVLIDFGDICHYHTSHDGCLFGTSLQGLRRIENGACKTEADIVILPVFEGTDNLCDCVKELFDYAKSEMGFVGKYLPSCPGSM